MAGLLGLVVAMLVAAAPASTAASGSWALTGTMTSPRASATATLLPNGKVLVAGGFTPQADSTASAELYDPATGTWAATGPMTTARSGQTASLLASGKVLVVGGAGAGGASVPSAELYDPATGTWAATGPMASAAGSGATATLLPGGSVLVAGGAIESGCCGGIVAADLYDPSSGTWQAAANMNFPREAPASVVLPDGAVLMTGGYEGITPTPYLASTEIYQPVTNTWTPGPDMNQGRGNQTATLLPDGRVLVAGGYAAQPEGSVLATAELYSPGTTPAPVVTGISPEGGPAAGGTAVTVSGRTCPAGACRSAPSQRPRCPAVGARARRHRRPVQAPWT